MKKFILFFVAILTINLSNAQAIEVIDAIAGSLLPEITKSVKSIIDSNVKNRKQEAAKEAVDNAVDESTKLLIDNLSQELENIENVNSVHTITRRMMISVGALDALSNDDLINSLEDAFKVKKEFTLLFVAELNNIVEDRNKLEIIEVTTLNALLRSDLKTAKENIDDALGKLKTNLGFAGGKLEFDSQNVDNYITAIKRSGDHIDNIKTSTESISRLIESYLEAYTGSFKKLKSSIEKKE